ncbi:MAG: response regulator [Nitrospinae bacterium]|nr:response regulator [Nitrospinota bacterium]
MAYRPDGKKRLLLVDDEEIVRILLAEYLTGLDLEIMEADNGKSALKAMLEQGRPDVIVSDIMMPDMDGLTFLSKTRNDPTMAHIPFMVITADDQPETRAKAMALGADDFVLKPLAQEAFVDMVKKFVA